MGNGLGDKTKGSSCRAIEHWTSATKLPWNGQAPWVLGYFPAYRPAGKYLARPLCPELDSGATEDGKGVGGTNWSNLFLPLFLTN